VRNKRGATSQGRLGFQRTVVRGRDSKDQGGDERSKNPSYFVTRKRRNDRTKSGVFVLSAQKKRKIPLKTVDHAKEGTGKKRACDLKEKYCAYLCP